MGEGTIVSSSLDWWYLQTPPPLCRLSYFYFNPFTEHIFGEYLLLSDPGAQRQFLKRVHNNLRKMHTKQVYSERERKVVFYLQVVRESFLKEVKPAAVTSFLLYT